ncbi:hypothetical protein CGCVW01_v009600 [Colletotrichum viniferum]|nr:hypothetical protein CGCVW01_v009600 [Colletotrichum viniferum]
MPISYTRNCFSYAFTDLDQMFNATALGLKINAVGDKPKALQLLWGKTFE